MELKRATIYIEGLSGKDRKTVEKGVTKVLAVYPDYMLAEASDSQISELQNQGLRVEQQKGVPTIRLKAVDIDTSSPPPQSPKAMALNRADVEKGGVNYWLVQFVGPAKEEWSDQITQLGGKFYGYVPDNAYLVHMSPAIKDQVKKLSFVNWVGLYEPVYKISPTLMGLKGKSVQGELGALSLKAEKFRPVPVGNINVIVHDPADLKKVTKGIEGVGGKVISRTKDLIRASLDLSVVNELVKMKEVKWVEPYIVPKLFNNVASGIVGVDEVRSQHGLDGDGQIVGIADTGLDIGVNNNTMSQDFQGRIDSLYSWGIPAGLHGYMDNTSWDDGPADLEVGHGTHVAGSVLGNGTRSGGMIRGMAFNSRLVFQAVEQWADWKQSVTNQYDLTDGYYLLGIPDDLGDLFIQAYNDGARIHTNSWGGVEDDSGNLSYSQYTTQSQQIDEFIWNHKDMIILFAAGNEGVDVDTNGVIDTDSLCVQATAKNCISVGASENNRTTGGYQSTYHQLWPEYSANPIRDDRPSNNPEGMAPFSSRGPCDDGRIKPDVVAPGTNILSVRSSVATEHGWGLLPAGDPSQPYYMFMGGTSMATPITAGTVALIRQYLVNVCVHTPTAALMKAMLIHGAEPMVGQYAPSETGGVPNGIEGWGRINLDLSLFPDYPMRAEFKDDPAAAVGTGEHRDYSYDVVDTTVPFKATLVWTDAPSEVPTGGGLVNRLRLSVITPGGTTVMGEPSNNNIQQVIVAAPQIGTYQVRVSGTSVATIGIKQDFALVVSAGLSFVELYLKDNAVDDGIPPSTGCMYLSPDIWVSLDNDPTAPPAANPEHGQTNYVFVKVHNRGSKAASNAEVKLYWANPGTNLSKPYWMTDGIKVDGAAGNIRYVDVSAHGGAGDGEAITTAFEWRPPEMDQNVSEPGHFCLFATVNHPEDPILQEDIQFVRWEDNLAWKNVTEVEQLADTPESMEFYVAGIEGASSFADIHIDKSSLPAGADVTLKMPKRYLHGSVVTDLDTVWESAGHLICKVLVTPGTRGTIGGIRLKPGENTLVRLEVNLPKDVQLGEAYPVFVEQRTNGIITGRVTLVVRPVGSPAFIGNRDSGEIHLPNCGWAKKMSKSHRVPYNDLDLAIRRGYNGCRYCLPQYSTD